MAEIPKRPLRVFLCHASADKPDVRVLYKRLISDGVDAWIDEEKLLPGQAWREVIPKEVRNSDIVIVCLSKHSVGKEGFVQKEIKEALDIADEKPEGTIFIIPARLDDCNVPNRLSSYQWVNLFEQNGYKKLLQALKTRGQQVGRPLIKKQKLSRRSRSSNKVIELNNRESIRRIIDNYVIEHPLLPDSEILRETERLLKLGKDFETDLPKSIKTIENISIVGAIAVEFVVRATVEERYKFYSRSQQVQEAEPEFANKDKQGSKTGYIKKAQRVRQLFFDFLAPKNILDERYEKPTEGMDIIWTSCQPPKFSTS